MDNIIRSTAIILLAMGLSLGSAASYAGCESHCRCQGVMAMAGASDAGTYMTGSAGNCCCDLYTDYRGESEVAAVTGTDESRALGIATLPPATGAGARPAGDRQLQNTHAAFACNSPPIYKLVSSYII